jgi:hypothetical protein
MSKKILFAMFCIILIVLTPISFGQNATGSSGPAIAVELPRYIDDDEIAIVGGTAPGATAELWVNGQLRWKADLPDGVINLVGVDLLANDDNQILIRATDASGTNERQYTVFSDLTRPKIELTTAVPDITASKSLAVRGTVSEIAKVEMFINNGNVFTAENTKIFAANITLAEGGNNLSITATDMAGHIGRFSKTIMVDTVPPTIEDIVPARDAFYYQGRAVDDVAGKTEPFAKVTLYYDYEAVVGNETKREKVAETDADASGFFEFKDINFESPAPGIKLREVSPEEYTGTAAEQTTIKPARFILVAKDLVGLTTEASFSVSVGTCWSGWFAFDINVLPEYQRPTLMSPERLKEGTEVMSFIMNLSYGGSSPDFKIMNIRVDHACGRSKGSLAEEYKDDPRYQIACDLLFSSSPSFDSNRAKTLWYVEYTHLRSEQFTNLSEDFWKDFASHELIFPLKITVGYQEKKPDGTWTATQYQVKCVPLAYFVDIPIDPRKVLPDWLLEGGIDFANQSIQTLDKIIPPITQARDVAGAACIGSWLARWAVKVYRIAACKWDSMIGERMRKQGQDSGKTCPPEEAKEEGGESRLGLTDEQLQTQCSACANAWKAESKLYIAYRWSCDRIFCHQVPSAWTEKATDVEIFQAEEKAKACASDEIAGVLPLTQVKNCYKEYKDKLDPTRFGETKSKPNICYKYGAEDTTALYVATGATPETKTVDGKDIEVYALQRASTTPGVIGIRAAPETLKVVKSGNKYATATAYSCKELCKKIYHTNVTAACVDAKQCVKKGGQYDGHVAGYSVDECWFGKPADFDMSQQCCCYVPKEKEEEKKPAAGKEWTYRQQTLYKETDEEYGTNYPEDRYISERDMSACFGQESIFDYGRAQGEKIAPMLDPYSQHTSALQCLCLTGIIGRLQLLRQIMAGIANCFEQIKTTGEADAGVCKELFTEYICDMIYDVFVGVSKGCITLPFTRTRIEFGKGVSTSVAEPIDMGAPSVGEALKIGLGSVFDATRTMAEDLADEYGNTTLSNFLQGGEQMISRKLCLAAFGFDVGLDFRSLMEMSYQVQFTTSVSAFGARREFLTYNPATGIPTYEYRTSWAIFPGCEIRDYSVELVCVNADEQARYNGIDCAAVNDLQHGDAPSGCNCLYSDKPAGERSRLFKVEQGVEAGIFEDKDYHLVVDDSTVRYDHLKIKINLASGYDAEKCFPDGHEDGIFYFPIADKTARDLLDCFVDQRGVFRCTRGIEWEKQGTAWFMPFGADECGYGQQCYMLCQDPRKKGVGREQGEWIDCSKMKYGISDSINVMFKVQGTKEQCIDAYILNSAGTKLGDPSREIQQIGEKTIEGEYTTTKNIGFGVVGQRDFEVPYDYSIYPIAMNETMPLEETIKYMTLCFIDRVTKFDTGAPAAGDYLINFTRTSKFIFTMKVPAGVKVMLDNKTLSSEELAKPYTIDAIQKQMVFVIGGMGTRITVPSEGGRCLFRIERITSEQNWRVHAELRYPDAAGICSADATTKTEPAVGEVNEIEQVIQIYRTAPAIERRLINVTDAKSQTEAKLAMKLDSIFVGENITEFFEFAELLIGRNMTIIYPKEIASKELRPYQFYNTSLTRLFDFLKIDYDVLSSGDVQIFSANSCNLIHGICRIDCTGDESSWPQFASDCPSNTPKCCWSQAI